jgi:hypothetical protein
LVPSINRQVALLSQVLDLVAVDDGTDLRACGPATHRHRRSHVAAIRQLGLDLVDHPALVRQALQQLHGALLAVSLKPLDDLPAEPTKGGGG